MIKLPYKFNYNDPDILKAVSEANGKLGELNGLISSMENPYILLNAIILGEAKESSEIENIVTTFDKIYREIVLKNQDTQSKEVVNYREAVVNGTKLIKENDFISSRIIEEIHYYIEPNVGGIRKIPGTVIKNTKTGEVLHTPPQGENEIREYLDNLEKYINYDELEENDPLIKMSMIHFQFESIHPFHDGNGRTGRILNVLYLVLKKKLKWPILYLSKYINANKLDYYKLLQGIRINDKYLKDYIMFMVNGVKEMSIYTINFINEMQKLINEARDVIKEKLPKIYSDDLVEYLFYDFYTKNEYFRNRLKITRNTSAKYLKELVSIGVLGEEKVGREVIYKNNYLYKLTV